MYVTNNVTSTPSVVEHPSLFVSVFEFYVCLLQLSCVVFHENTLLKLVRWVNVIILKGSELP